MEGQKVVWPDHRTKGSLMVMITFVEPDGTTRTIDGLPGRSVMEVAVSNGVIGIKACCGGACSCGTCHVYVDPDRIAILPAPTAQERFVLRRLSKRSEFSRLACQLKAVDQIDGLTVHIPLQQAR